MEIILPSPHYNGGMCNLVLKSCKISASSPHPVSSGKGKTGKVATVPQAFQIHHSPEEVCESIHNLEAIKIPRSISSISNNKLHLQSLLCLTENYGCLGVLFVWCHYFLDG